MATSQVVVDVEREEEEIENLIEFLQQYKPAQKLDKSLDSPITKTPKEKISKPGRGRPPKNKPVTEVPPLSPIVTSKEGPFKPSTFDVVIECLQKLNNRNKLLVNRVVELDSQLQIQNKKIEELSLGVASNSNHENIGDSQDVKEVAERVKVLEKAANPEFLNRVLEGNIHSHFLLCRGPRVTSKIEESTNDGATNLNQIKAELCNEICGGCVPEISVDSLSVTLHGKDKNMLKIECVNTFTRNFLIKQARSRKPRGIYLVEFLPSDKVRVYRSLHNLRKEPHRKKIRSIHIKNTDIFCKIENEERFIRVNSLADVDEIKKQLSGASIVSPTNEGRPDGAD